MNCPDCGQKLEAGYLHSRGMIWTEQIRRFLLIPGQNGIHLHRVNGLCGPRHSDAYLCRSCQKLYLNGGNSEGDTLQLQAPPTPEACPRCGKPVITGYLQGNTLFWGREPFTLERLAYQNANTLPLDNQPVLGGCYPSVRCRHCRLVVADLSSLTPADQFATKHCRRISNILLVGVGIASFLAAIWGRSFLWVVLAILAATGMLSLSNTLLRWWARRRANS